MTNTTGLTGEAIDASWSGTILPTGGPFPRTSRYCRDWTFGSCHALAIAIHRLTGFPMAMIVGRTTRSESAVHVMAALPEHEGIFLDANGRQSLACVLENVILPGTGYFRLDQNLSEADLYPWYRRVAGLWRPSNEAIRDAFVAAKEILRDEDICCSSLSIGSLPRHA